MVWQTNDGLTRKHFLLSCRWVEWMLICNVQRYRWRCTIPWRCLEEIKQRSLARQWPLLFIQDLFIARNLLYNSLPSCCYALLLLNSVSKHPDACYYESKPLVKTVTAMVPRLSASSRPLCSRISRTSLIVSTEWWEFSNLQTCSALDYELARLAQDIGPGDKICKSWL